MDTSSCSICGKKISSRHWTGVKYTDDNSYKISHWRCFNDDNVSDSLGVIRTRETNIKCWLDLADSKKKVAKTNRTKIMNGTNKQKMSKGSKSGMAGSAYLG
jgi:hypothetical protein